MDFVLGKKSKQKTVKTRFKIVMVQRETDFHKGDHKNFSMVL